MTTRDRRRQVLALGLTLVTLITPAACSSDDGGEVDTVPTSTTVDLGPDEGDGILRIATALAPTDARAVQAAAIALAVDDVNAGGGVLGTDVELVGGELTDVLDTVDVVIGVDDTDGRLAEHVTGGDVVWIAPSGPDGVPPTNARLAFRTGATTVLLAQAAADLVVDDGATSAAVAHRAARAQADAVVEALRRAGVEATTADVDAILAAGPDSVVVAGPRDAAPVVEELVAGGYSPADHGVYLVGSDDNATIGDRLASRSGVLEGVDVLRAGAEVTGALRDRLAGFDDLTGAAEAYDAVVIAALAAEGAQTDDPDHLASVLAAVTRGGATCTTYEECRRLVDDGADIDFDGQGGSYALGADGRPTEGVVSVLEFGSDNQIDPNRTEYRVATAPT